MYGCDMSVFLVGLAGLLRSGLLLLVILRFAFGDVVAIALGD